MLIARSHSDDSHVNATGNKATRLHLSFLEVDVGLAGSKVFHCNMLLCYIGVSKGHFLWNSKVEKIVSQK